MKPECLVDHKQIVFHIYDYKETKDRELEVTKTNEISVNHTGVGKKNLYDLIDKLINDGVPIVTYNDLGLYYEGAHDNGYPDLEVLDPSNLQGGGEFNIAVYDWYDDEIKFLHYTYTFEGEEITSIDAKTFEKANAPRNAIETGSHYAELFIKEGRELAKQAYTKIFDLNQGYNKLSNL